jgi:uncharacterized membrane protein
MDIKIKRNALDIIEAIVSLLCLVGVVVYLILAWSRIPDQIPAHYNAVGEVNRWGSKSALIVPPIISWVLYGFITLVERYPQVWNTGVTVTEQNRTRVYRILKNLIAVIKMLMLLVFASMTVLSSLTLRLPIWYLGVFLLAVFGSIAFFIAQLNRTTRVEKPSAEA